MNVRIENRKVFAFGANWSRFLSTVDDQRIEAAKASLLALLNDFDLNSKRVLDAGSGSGLFSLAANHLGAEVTSIDIDTQSVRCTHEMRSRYGNKVDTWVIEEGSILDKEFLFRLGSFDVVYCWGVAHHTGNMWAAIENLADRVKHNGKLVLAIYNDQLYVSKIWRAIKRFYNRMPAALRPLFVFGIGSVLAAKRFCVTLAASLLRLATLRNPFVPFINWRNDVQGRGMHSWYDLVDWVGGWPFEVAKPEDIFRALRERGFVLSELTTSQGHGCNEFVFTKAV